MYEKGRRSGLCVGVLLLSLLVFSASAEARTYHVTQNGGGDKGGGDWNNALDEGGLRNKLKESENGDVFWVAKGIYRPSGEKDLNASFVLKEGVKLYGGFKGDEASLEARDPKINVTVLTGDLDGDDKRDGNGATPKAGDIVGENSYTVVRSSKCTAAAVLDGFTVCGGIGEKGKVENHAGGMHNIESSPTITRCVFSGNKAVRPVYGQRRRNVQQQRQQSRHQLLHLFGQYVRAGKVRRRYVQRLQQPHRDPLCLLRKHRIRRRNVERWRQPGHHPV